MVCRLLRARTVWKVLAKRFHVEYKEDAGRAGGAGMFQD